MFALYDRRQVQRNICLAVGVICYLLGVGILVLQIWYLFDQSGDFREIVVSGPLILSLAAMLTASGILMLKNRKIGETINRLQDINDQREFELRYFDPTDHK